MYIAISTGFLQYRKALWQTIAAGLLICVSWAWMFRNEHASYRSLAEALRYSSWSEGFHLWLVSLDMGTSLLASCMIMPLPLVLASKGGRSLTPALVATAYLVGMMWFTDFCNDGNSWRSWFSTPGLFRLAFLFMPVTTAFVACGLVPNLYGLTVACMRPQDQVIVRKFSFGDGVKILFLIALNLVCVFAAALVSKWLKHHELGPFFKGFWHGSAAFLSAPTSLFRLCANSPTPILLLGCAGFLVAIILLVGWRTGDSKAMLRSLFLGLIISSLSVVWLAGDVVFNYYPFAEMERREGVQPEALAPSTAPGVSEEAQESLDLLVRKKLHSLNAVVGAPIQLMLV